MDMLKRKALSGETIIIRWPRAEARQNNCYKNGDRFQAMGITADGVIVHSEKPVPESMRWSYKDDRSMYVEDWEYCVEGMKAEIGDIIVVVNPAISDGCYGLGDKFKVLNVDEFGVRVAIEGCDDDFLRCFGKENTSFIEHKEYEVMQKGKTD